ncbi:hypothetical protein CcaverHIS002_0113630 [Cutaneotrichosporon cavernicola]|uniref:Uncharacterized protein n=1 Tax=Cutaneotrichosporon cavernicola TaxID=279322 RepID=A0AA48I3E5_9TREE|nr:uncharacterized protein CcaverHIS019_0113500 [Cutaneotrichosporon cavernicola]BEI80834.1 hypothetical protein CcaverHIS002_0113630 [Cutaneotrichosporon cavernicola]BEI88632.1 hypothetical protein CcaverHIS019_0113500 [Cutaneotrichosporon cavernicola]BEI96405.1 hypothetical protein CcaverHIS631_0113540 [Cutaneotrichosporon cavernicola]BEJ04177.1 hypothetical protein CcaverHIS641_0113520 [Cutaneotrichosporon cavernicola]
MDAIGPLETPLRLVKGDQISDEPVTLRIPNRNIGIRGQDYEITNEETGKVMYKVKGSPISFHSTQLFCSADGKDKLFEIKYYNGNHPHFEAQRCDVIDISSDWMAGPLAIFAAYEKVYSNGDVTKQAQIYLMSQDKVRPGAVVGPRLILRGDMDTEASVVLRSTGQVLAVIRPGEKPAGGAVEENERGRAGVSGTSSFLVTVAPGMDIAAMAGIAASYNQLHNRSSAGSAGQSRANSRAPSRSASRNPSRRGSAAPVPVVNVPQHLA